MPSWPFQWAGRLPKHSRHSGWAGPAELGVQTLPVGVAGIRRGFEKSASVCESCPVPWPRLPRPNRLSYVSSKIGSSSWKGKKEAFLQGAVVKRTLVQLGDG